jgi:DNA-binding NarL/FixJ family response regulator
MQTQAQDTLRTGTTAIRVAIADDHALLRGGVRSLLTGLPDIEVVGEAANGQQVLTLARSTPLDVVLMDISMAGMNGLEATERLAKESPRVRVVILSIHEDREYVQRALRAGAVGYVLKDAEPAELLLAVRTVAAGRPYLGPTVSRHIVETYGKRAGSDATLADLTERQREILHLIAKGTSSRRIATALSISVKTVEAHRTRLMQRLGIHDLAGLVRFAVRSGLVPLED